MVLLLVAATEKKSANKIAGVQIEDRRDHLAVQVASRREARDRG